MALLFANNAITSLTAAITNIQTSITVADAAAFPAPVNPDYFILTVTNQTNGLREIMHCSGRAGNVLTVVRAQESTPGQAFDAGAQVSMQITKGLLEYLRDN